MAEWREVYRDIVTAEDCDANRHMSVLAYFPRFDDSVFAMMVAAGLSREAMLRRNLSAAAVVHDIRYLAELAQGARYVIEGAYIALGRASFRIGLRMREADAGTLVATFTSIETMFDFTARKSAPVPADWRAAIGSLLVRLGEDEAAHYAMVSQAA